jgi:hypothetical protein
MKTRMVVVRRMTAYWTSGSGKDAGGDWYISGADKSVRVSFQWIAERAEGRGLPHLPIGDSNSQDPYKGAEITSEHVAGIVNA